MHIGNIYKHAAAAKAMTLEAARAGANGEADALAKILAARIVASEAAIECGRLSMRVGGGKAYNKSTPYGKTSERCICWTNYGPKC